MGLTIDQRDIDRAHRLGRHAVDKQRPIIIKFNTFKTKDKILSNGRKLKDTEYSVGEDFSAPVRNARRHLIAFARSQSSPFMLSFKTLHMGKKRYIFDESTQTVKELL